MAGLSLTTLTVFALTFVGNPTVFVAGISVLGFALFAVRPVIQGWMMDLVPPPLAASGTSLLFVPSPFFPRSRPSSAASSPTPTVC